MSAEHNIETKINVIPESGRLPEFPPDRYRLIAAVNENYAAFSEWIVDRRKDKKSRSDQEKELFAGFSILAEGIEKVSGRPVVTDRALCNDIAKDNVRHDFQDPYSEEAFAWNERINIGPLVKFIQFRIDELSRSLRVDFRNKSNKDKASIGARIGTYLEQMQTIIDSSVPFEEAHNIAENPKAYKARKEEKAFKIAHDPLRRADDPEGKSEEETDRISKENWRKAEEEFKEWRELFIPEKVNDTLGCGGTAGALGCFVPVSVAYQAAGLGCLLPLSIGYQVAHGLGMAGERVNRLPREAGMAAIEAKNGCLPIFTGIYGLGSDFKWMAKDARDDISWRLTVLDYDIKEWGGQKKNNFLDGFRKGVSHLRTKYEELKGWRPDLLMGYVGAGYRGYAGFEVGRREIPLTAPVKSPREDEEERKRRGCLVPVVGAAVLLLLTQLGPCESDYSKLEENPGGSIPGNSELLKDEYLSLYGKFLADLAEFDPKVFQMLAGEPKATELAKLQEEIKAIKEANDGNIPAKNGEFNRAVHLVANALGSEDVQLFWRLYVERYNKLNPESPLVEGVSKVEDRFDDEYPFTDYEYNPSGRIYPSISRLPEGLIIPPPSYFLDPRLRKEAANIFKQVDRIILDKGELI